jgi:CBS domain containing-hemolysin-like protein
MDTPSAETAFILFLLSLAFSGLLSGIKTVLGYFQKQNFDLALSSDSPHFKEWMEEAAQIWKRPGFFESLTIGRFLFDASSLFFGASALTRSLPIGWGLAFTISALATFAISHWGLSLLAQAKAPALGGLALKLYRVYGFVFMGSAGKVIHEFNESLLRRLGYEPRLGFLRESERGHSHPEAGENVDRSGLEDEEKEMIRSIFDLRETQAKEIMTPRVDVVALEVSASYREVMDCISQEKFSRIPVFEENIDHIRGILHGMDLMGLPEEAAKQGFRLGDYIREAYFVPRTKKIGELLREFRQQHIHMAIVVDEYGGTSGLITMEDILEEIVGEIHDEDEVETHKIRKLEEGVYAVDPVISLSDLKEEIGVDLRPEDDEVHLDTLGGFILYVHGRVPQQGDVVRHKEFSFEITEMDGNKIERVKLLRQTLAPAEAK